MKTLRERLEAVRQAIQSGTATLDVQGKARLVVRYDEATGRCVTVADPRYPAFTGTFVVCLEAIKIG
jgi:hypothetical protein